jgi:acetyltransferase (GNAT) family protein
MRKCREVTRLTTRCSHEDALQVCEYAVGGASRQQAPRLMRKVNIRFSRNEDARGILEAHYSAVHRTAFKDYAPEICNEWSTPVTQERISQYLNNSLPHETTLVAEVDGEIAGFGAIVESENELRAVYVAAEFGRCGIGSAQIAWLIPRLRFALLRVAEV